MRVNLNQGSEDWHLWRAKGIGGSDIAAIMGDSPWVTAYQLWEQKTGRVERPDISEMFHVKRGIRLEPVARAMYEEQTGTIVPEGCYIDDEFQFMKASLDGITEDERLVVEIKCPGEAAHQLAMVNKVPVHYMWQVQDYLRVTGAEEAHYVSLFFFDDMPDLQIVHVPRDEDMIERLVYAAQGFMNHIEQDVPPPMTEQDTEDVSEEVEWQGWEMEMLEVRADLKVLEAREKYLKKKMQGRATHRTVSGSRLQSVRFWKAGALDSKKWLEDNNHVVPEEYRKKGTYQIQIREVKPK